MTLQELHTILTATGFPVAYSHFTSTPESPAPPLPFITYIVPSTENMGADNRTYHKINNVQVELYTKKKDLSAEQIVEDLLDANDIFYDADEVWIEEESVFQRIYELGVN